MHRNEFKQKWNEIKKSVQRKWNKLTNSDVSEIEGDYDAFINKVHKRQGISREQAEREYQQWNTEGKQSGWGHEAEGQSQNEGRKSQDEKHMRESGKGQWGEKKGSQEHGYKSHDERHMGEKGSNKEQGGGFQEERGHKSQKDKFSGEKGSSKEYGPKEHGKHDEKNWGNDEKKRKTG